MSCNMLQRSARVTAIRGAGAVRVRALRSSPRCKVVVRASLSQQPENFEIPGAPDLVPEGPWSKVPGGVCAAKGFKATGGYGGLRASGKKADLSLIVADKDTTVAGVFTLNKMCAAPVLYCRDVLSRKTTTRAVLINAGQANAATGDQGYLDAQTSANALAAALAIVPDDVLLMSTGVIGKRIKIDELVRALPSLANSVGSDVESAHRSAVAITTTDLVSKEAALEIELDGKKVSVGGMCKGSGMIHPNMATMLGVITTDAAVSPEVWKTLLKQGADLSFNQITVDGDTSTNDTILGLASGSAGNALITDASSPGAKTLGAAVAALLQGLAKSIAWDGEGATCLMEVKVTGAVTDADARVIARTVCGSSLVKSAIFGHDPNWGRIAAAAGRAGVDFDQSNMAVTLGEIQLMDKGQPLAFDAKVASKYLKDTCAEHGTVHMYVSIGDGPGQGVGWGCDLSYKYVEINAEYTT